jgi:hypothetical protein
LSRATASNQRLLRLVSSPAGESTVSIARGIQRSAWKDKPANPSGMIPITVNGRSFRVMLRPTRPGSPPNRVRHAV